MKKSIKLFSIIFVFCVAINVNASIKCDAGKPGDTVNCVVTNNGSVGTIKRLKESMSEGLSFVSCDVCGETQYTIEEGKSANFKFKIDDKISETKKLSVTIGGESATINVNVENNTDNTDSDDTKVYTVTLVPGNGANKTLTCSVNSLNTYCEVTLDTIEDENFTGWGTKKDCLNGATGSVKVNKNITYYACYKKESDTTTTTTKATSSNELFLKSLTIKSGDKEFDINFSIRKFEYDLIVPLDVNSLDIDAVASDGVSVNVSGNENLEESDNKITISLSDNDGNTSEYIINVAKNNDVELPKLSSLVIGGYNIGFSSDKFVYTLEIDNNINSLNIDYETDDELIVDIIGNENLKNGSQIKINVTDEESDATSTYIINIEKPFNSIYIYIAIGGIVLVILIILLIIVVNKGKKKGNGKTNNGPKQVKPQIKGTKTSKMVNIPEVKPVIPTAPTNNPNTEKKDDIEILDF